MADYVTIVAVVTDEVAMSIVDKMRDDEGTKWVRDLDGVAPVAIELGAEPATWSDAPVITKAP